MKASKLSPEQIDKFFKRHPNKPDFVAYYDDFIDENFAEYEDCEDFAGYEHFGGYIEYQGHKQSERSHTEYQGHKQCVRSCSTDSDPWILPVEHRVPQNIFINASIPIIDNVTHGGFPSVHVLPRSLSTDSEPCILPVERGGVPQNIFQNASPKVVEYVTPGGFPSVQVPKNIFEDKRVTVSFFVLSKEKIRL